MDTNEPRSSRRPRRVSERRKTRTTAAPTAPKRGVTAAFAALGAGLAAQSGLAATLTVNTNADGAPVADASLTLREAVLQANAAAGPDIIQFAPALSGQTITLDNTQGQIKIKDDLDITGLGAAQLTVSGNGNQRIFYIYSPAPLTPITVNVSGLTLRLGEAGVDNDGGAILSHDANLHIVNSLLTLNHAGRDGGAIAFHAYGDGDPLTVVPNTLSLVGTTVSQNVAVGNGGGVSFYGSHEGTDGNGALTYGGDLIVDSST